MLTETSVLFPYKVRPVQKGIICHVAKALKDGGHTVIEAGTGSGKTVSVLAPALEHAYSTGKRVLYLTRTNSQERQVVEEFRRIKAHSSGTGPAPEQEMSGNDVVADILKELNEGIAASSKAGGSVQMEPPGGPWDGGPAMGLCAALQGRNNMCPLAAEDPEFFTGTPEELSRMCMERKRNTLSRMSGKPTGGKECRFYSAFLLDDGADTVRWARTSSPTAEELASHCLSQGTCPYETTKRMVEGAALVTAPYIFFLSPFIRGRLLDWMGAETKDLIVIVDEAHNVAHFARELCSISLSLTTLRLALSEVQAVGDARVCDEWTVSTLLTAFSKALETIAEEYLIDEDGLVPPSALMDTMMVQLRTNSSRLVSGFSEMLQYGASIQDTRRAQGRLPRSYIHRAAQFFLSWNELDFSACSPLVVKGQRPGELSLEAFAMDPSRITSELGRAYSSIHMSGTLSPLEEYRDTLGLPDDTDLVKLPPPFPPGNRVVAFFDDLCTSFEMLRKDPDMRTKYRERIIEVLGGLKGRNTALFFPSFDLMEEVLGTQELEDGGHLVPSLHLGRPIFLEKRGSSQSEVMELVDLFRASEGGLLASVMGGRLSEGMDYPGRSLELVLIVGIPYPKPNARQRSLSAYYDIKFGKGWEYTVHAPAARKMLQAIGRMIRSEEERGFAMILDRRAFHFRQEIGEMPLLNRDPYLPIRFFSGKD